MLHDTCAGGRRDANNMFPPTEGTALKHMVAITRVRRRRCGVRPVSREENENRRHPPTPTPPPPHDVLLTGFCLSFQISDVRSPRGRSDRPVAVAALAALAERVDVQNHLPIHEFYWLKLVTPLNLSGFP